MDRIEITAILASVLERAPEVLCGLPADAPLADLGFDSIKYIEFVVAIEKKFGVEILDSDLLSENFETKGALFRTLEKYFNKSSHVYKCVVCDCDGVLWKGVAGEAGSDAAYADGDTLAFARTLAGLKNKGVYVCLCSKNSEAAIAETFASLPEMPLSIGDIAIVIAGVKRKFDAVAKIADGLGISTDSVVFVDDSEYELGLVNTLLPEVTAIKADYESKSFIYAVAELFSDMPTQNLDRTRLYREQKEREKARVSAATEEEYNEKLGTKVMCRAVSALGALDAAQAERIAELSQRTNRFNMSGKRYSPKDIARLHSDPDCRIYLLDASDIYGDMGLVAAAIVHCGLIDNIMLSCRVLGRGFEKVLIDKIKADAKSALSGVYVETDKNREHRDFYARHGVSII